MGIIAVIPFSCHVLRGSSHKSATVYRTQSVSVVFCPQVG